MKMVRTISGPFLDRRCFEAGTKKFIWMEVPREGSHYSRPMTKTALCAVRSLLTERFPFSCLNVPVFTPDPAYVYAPADCPDLMVDIICFTKHVGADSLAILASRLTELLLGLHCCPLPNDIPLPHCYWRTSALDKLLGFSTENDTLTEDDLLLSRCLRQHPSIYDRAVLASSAYRDPHKRVLLHGRLSLGAIHLSTSGDPIVMTGLDCWLGPGESDIGYLVGELIELSCALQPSDPRLSAELLRCAVECAISYGSKQVRQSVEDSLSDITLFVCYRIVDHLARIASRFGFRRAQIEERLVSIAKATDALLSRLAQEKC